MNAYQDMGTRFPPPKTPVSPILSSHSCALKRRNPPTDSILGRRQTIHVSSGRAAICLALEHAGIQQSDEVLVPAYHCESMVAPVRWRQATPVFYRVQADTAIDLDDIRTRITPRTKAIIATHYFGFLQNLNPLRSLCDELGILLIEDCAHAFYGSGFGHNVGEWGDYAIASSMKFFPVYDGGLLASDRHNLDQVVTHKAPLLFTLKSLLNALERSVAFGRWGWLGKATRQLLALKSTLWGGIKSLSAGGRESGPIHGPGSSDGGYALDEDWIHIKSARTSKWIIEHADFALNQSIRRKHYQIIAEAVARIPGLRPLFAELPEQITPLIFPAYIDEPGRFFAPLKEAGVPIWRFGEYLDPAIDATLCPNSLTLSAHVFQFPCHQEITTAELNWMLTTLERIMRTG